MSRRVPPTPAAPAPPGPSRRRFLGGALAAVLTAAVVPRDAAPRPPRDRWRQTTRWIGHA